MDVLPSPCAGNHSFERFKRAMAMSCPEGTVSQHRANVTLLVSDGCWLSDLEIVYQTWTYVTRGEHIALAGAFLLWLRCNFPVSQQIRQNKCSGFANNVPCWWHYLWRCKRSSLSEERRHWGQVSCRSQFVLPFTLFRRWILIFLLWLPNYLPRVFLLISPHWQLGLQGMNERR